MPHSRIGHAPAARLVLLDAGKPLIGFQRIAAGGDKIHHVVEIGSREPRIGRCRKHFRIELIGEERFAAGAAEHVLGQYIERAGPQRWSILRVFADGVDRNPALQHLKTIGRHKDRARGFVDVVIGPADPLHQPRCAFRRADVDHEIDVTPVHAEIERGGTDHAAQLSGRHRVLDLAALGDIQRAVMQRDRQTIVIHAPEILEQHFGLASGVDEHQRGLVVLDQVIDFAQRMPRRVAGPRQPLAGVEHFHDRRRRAAGDHDVGGFAPPPRCGTRNRAAIPVQRPWPTVRSSAFAAPVATAAPARATADRRAWKSRAHATRRARPAEAMRTEMAHHPMRATAPVAREWSAERPADNGAGAAAAIPGCRRCGSRP